MVDVTPSHHTGIGVFLPSICKICPDLARGECLAFWEEVAWNRSGQRHRTVAAIMIWGVVRLVRSI